LSVEWHQFNCDSVNIMMIVMPTRSDLRDEFAMVDEVFALSPLSARPAQPSEADYEAIRDAFMETSRGRWFLGEYAKRNRNADTSMVLDAVARIELALAAQRQLQEQELADSTALPDAIAAIRRAVDDATLAAAAAVDGLALEENLAPVRKGARILKEISWRWREIGADSRICDLIDSQLGAIEAACNQLASADPKALLGAAFDIIKARLAEFDSAGSTATPEPAAAAAPGTEPDASIGTAQSEPGVAVEAAAAATETAGDITAKMPAAVTETSKNIPSPAQTIAELREELAELDESAEFLVDAGPTTSTPPELSTEAAADAHDAAILELIAAEMAAADPVEEEPARISTITQEIEEPILVDDDIVATFPEPAVPLPEPKRSASATLSVVPAAPAPQAVEVATTPARPSSSVTQPRAEATTPTRPTSATIQAVAKAIQEVAQEPSLGATVLANGLVPRQPAANDPLTPIRRMTQPEKIAFFS
jgi:hypothetical protein